MKTPHLLIVCMLTLWTLFTSILLSSQAQEINIPEPVPLPAAVREAFNLDPFYQQWVDVNGFPVVASAKVSPYAVKEAAYLVYQMTKHRPDILQALVEAGARLAVMATTEHLTDIPENRGWPVPYFHAVRGRAIGGDKLVVNEETMLNYLGNPYKGSNSVFHEFGHTVDYPGLNRVDPGFDDRLRRAYESAVKQGSWKGTYTAVNKGEYWAEGSEAWFYPNGHVNAWRYGDTREALKAHDPGLAALLIEVYGDDEWRYTLPETRLHQPHLQGFDPQNTPTFQYPPDAVALYEELLWDPESTGDGRWINLEPYPLSELPRLRASRTKGEPTEIIIGNFMGDNVLLVYSIAPDGTEYFRYRLRGDMKPFNTHVGELWLIKDSNGNNLSVYRAEAETGRVLFLPERCDPKIIDAEDLANISTTWRPGPKIEGPWLWMIASTSGYSGQETICSEKDWLAEASGGTVTEKEITINGATAGARVGNRVWTISKIAPIGGNNITEIVNATGLGEGDYVNNHVAYGLIALDSPYKQETVMYVGSDDAVKVWLNGVLIHKNPEDRGAFNYQERFSITLERGENILLVAVYNGGWNWSGFFGFDKDAKYSILPSPMREDVNKVVNIPEPVPPPAAVREAFDLDLFYQQWVDVNGFPVLASANVSPYAVKEAAYLIRQVLGHRLDILRTFAQNKERFSIIGYNETTTQIPEYSYLQPDFYQDIRNRGLGSADRNLTTSCSEENLLHYQEDPYFGFSVLFHELAHAVHERGLNRIDPEFDNLLRITYKAAMTKGLWKDTFAAVNHKEYWAEASEAWFNPKTTASFDRFGDTREDLKAYDPDLAALLIEVYGDDEWRYVPPETRLHEPHLQGFDPQNSPTFQWPPDTLALYEAFTRDPKSTGDGRWVNLQAYPPSELPRLQASRRGGNTTLIVIGNFGVDDVHVYWVALDGTEYFHNRLRGDMASYDTHVGGLWLLKDDNGKPLSVYRAETKMGRILILPEAENNNSPQVKIPDANLAAAVRQELGLAASTPITEQVMQRLTTLGAPAREITNLTGLEHAKRLVRLDLWENQIQDVSPLLNLTQLQQLHLQANRITDIKAFAGLTELRYLHLWGNQIRDISVLANLTKLESLLLAGNPIQDNSPLHSLLKRNPDMELDIEVVLPELADINEDGRINAADLLLVVTALIADTPTNPRTDVNGDGAVNVADLLVVIEYLEDPVSAAAPTSMETATPLDGEKLQAQLNILHAENDGTFKYQGAIAFLQNLLSVSRPGKTRLLANYPNPFNPETWMPYQLAKATEVRILIYDSSGTVVRRLVLGHQPAGYYTSRSHAAYWNGKNEVGETVASGFYFYTLEADDLTATRKMLIRK